VRNLCPVAVKNLDDLAKGKDLSRQAFLKEKPETLSIVEEETERGQAIDNLYN
jgi:hypothetical protein